MKIISILLHIISFIIYLIGCAWFGVSLNIVGGLTLVDIGFYLVLLPTIAGFVFFDKLIYKWDIITYFLTLIYFLLSLSYFTEMNVFDINIYLIFIPVVLAFTIDKFNSTFNTSENLEKFIKNKSQNSDEDVTI